MNQILAQPWRRWCLVVLLSATAMVAHAQSQPSPPQNLETTDQQVAALVKSNPMAAYPLAIDYRRQAAAEENVVAQSKANAYLSAICIRINKLDSTLHFAQQALNFATQAADSAEVVNSYNAVGNAYEATGKADSARIAFQQGLQWAIPLGIAKSVARCYLNIGMIERTLGNYPQSLEMLQAAKAICLHDSIPSFLPNIFLTLGEVYTLMADHASAIDYLYQALDAARGLHVVPQIGRAMFTLGGVAGQSGDTLEALCWFQEALSFAKDNHLRGLEAKAGAQVADVYAKLGKLDLAMAAASAAADIAKTDHDVISMGMSYEILGKVYLQAKRYDNAYKACAQAYHLALELRQFNAVANTCDCMWRSAEQAGHFREAFVYYREYVHWQDSLTGAENALQVARIEERLRFEQQHLADSLAQVQEDLVEKAAYEKTLDEERLLRQRVLLGGIFFMVLAGLGAGALVIFKRQNRRLTAQNILIQSQNKSIQQALDDKEVLLREVHHRVKNNLQIMASLLDIQVGQTADGAARDTLLASKGRVQSMSLIHQKLYQQDHMAALAFDAYLQQLVEAIQAMFTQAEQVLVTYELDPCTLGIDLAVPLGLILNELVTNAYKYAFAGRPGGQLIVHLKRMEGDAFALVVQDNGPGLPPDFDARRVSTLGLSLIQGLTRQLQGSFAASNVQTGGARFTITFQGAIS